MPSASSVKKVSKKRPSGSSAVFASVSRDSCPSQFSWDLLIFHFFYYLFLSPRCEKS